MMNRKVPKHKPSACEKDKAVSQRFSHQAKLFWERIPEEIRQSLLENVWCRKCAGSTRIVDFREARGAAIRTLVL
jgi:hypothetical protein